MADTTNNEVNLILGKLKRHFGKTMETATVRDVYESLALCVRDEIIDRWITSKEEIDKQGKKMVIYMSAEFLIGRGLVNNLINLDLFDRYKKALDILGVNLEDVENEEHDAALGNGGLGRLAACFLDALSTLDLPAMGCGIRYEHGLFKQRILEGAQVEIPDDWIDTGYVWEVENDDEAMEIHFGGKIKEEWIDGKLHIIHEDYSTVIAVPYDMPIVGFETKSPATLRLWSARAQKNLDMQYFNKGDYVRASEERELAEVISKVLYPEDNHDAGRQLRLKQFYFFTSATMQYIVKRHKKLYGDLHTLPDYITVQINDTHPTLSIPELMRILMDKEGFGWDEAFHIVSRVFNYTNHTIMQEALECWPKDMFTLLLPRIYKIIEVLNEKYCQYLWQFYEGDFQKISSMSIIAYNQIRMANLCVAVCRKVNGVSQLHGDILKQNLFRDTYVINPSKFLAITNGITHRRWLLKANPGLAKLIENYIGPDFKKNYKEFSKLREFISNKEFMAEFARVKRENKHKLAEYVYQKQGIKLNEEAIFDVQCKRLHEYKRQLLKVLHILYLYNKAIADPEFIKQPIVFIFAAKASPGYARAKNIIRLINAVSDLVNNDERTNGKLQVVFIENYCVSAAEIMIPATDVSEQISTAGMEASGTGNMKFMMNGAVTIGTMDGANVEIFEQVSKDNMYIFGCSSDEIFSMKNHHSYRPADVYEHDIELRNVLSRLVDGSLPNVKDRQFSDIYQSLLFGDFGTADQYFVLKDFRSYVETYARLIDDYQDKEKWYKMAAMNTAMSGIFCADRTIEEYNELIWGLTPLE